MKNELILQSGERLFCITSIDLSSIKNANIKGYDILDGSKTVIELLCNGVSKPDIHSLIQFLDKDKVKLPNWTLVSLHNSKSTFLSTTKTNNCSLEQLVQIDTTLLTCKSETIFYKEHIARPTQECPIDLYAQGSNALDLFINTLKSLLELINVKIEFQKEP